MIPANYLRAQMHKPLNPATRHDVTNAQLLAENAELREEVAQLKREVKLMEAMKVLNDAQMLRILDRITGRVRQS